jgi:hypothetical protein
MKRPTQPTLGSARGSSCAMQGAAARHSMRPTCDLPEQQQPLRTGWHRGLQLMMIWHGSTEWLAFDIP